MIEVRHELDKAKALVKALQGREIKFKINKGRNKYISFEGFIADMYPSIFTIKSKDEGKLYSHSYNDILTKSVRFYKLSTVEKV